MRVYHESTEIIKNQMQYIRKSICFWVEDFILEASENGTW